MTRPLLILAFSCLCSCGSIFGPPATTRQVVTLNDGTQAVVDVPTVTPEMMQIQAWSKASENLFAR